jgi:hypothetical protein
MATAGLTVRQGNRIESKESRGSILARRAGRPAGLTQPDADFFSLKLNPSTP